jgi:excisionase family DNA binding protein
MAGTSRQIQRESTAGIAREAKRTGGAGEPPRRVSIVGRPNGAEEPGALKGPGEIPAWAFLPSDQDGPSDSAPTYLTSRSLDASAARIAASPFRPLMTVAEAAAVLRVSTKTIRRMLSRDELNRVIIGRLMRIRAEDIERHILRCTSIWPY